MKNELKWKEYKKEKTGEKIHIQGREKQQHRESWSKVKLAFPFNYFEMVKRFLHYFVFFIIIILHLRFVYIINWRKNVGKKAQNEVNKKKFDERGKIFSCIAFFFPGRKASKKQQAEN